MSSPNGFLDLLIILISSTLPIVLLIALGYLARRQKILQAGDVRVFSAYVYYFALPGLFISNLSQTTLHWETLVFIFWALLPVILLIGIFIVFSFLFSINRGTISLVIICTAFGSVVFFGIPYITFVFPAKEAEYLASLAAVPIAILGAFISITTLELYSLKTNSIMKGLITVAKRFTKNPLILSMTAGILLSVFNVTLPGPLQRTLSMLGGTTSTTAIFLVGLFFYGQDYSGFFKALKLSLLRLFLLPAFAFVLYSRSNLPELETSIVVLLHGMPAAVNLIVLSERYNFYKNIIPTYLLVSTLGAFVSLGVWYLITV